MDFERFSNWLTNSLGTPKATLLAFSVIAVWAATGPMFGFSDTWQLIINTGTTIVTFLMVFILQATQNRDSKAQQAKLDELIEASRASNRLVGADEDLTADEIAEIREQLRRAKDSGQGDQSA